MKNQISYYFLHTDACLGLSNNDFSSKVYVTSFGLAADSLIPISLLTTINNMKTSDTFYKLTGLFFYIKIKNEFENQKK